MRAAAQPVSQARCHRPPSQQADGAARIKALYAQLSVGPVTPFVRELTVQTFSRKRSTDEAREASVTFVEMQPAHWHG